MIQEELYRRILEKRPHALIHIAKPRKNKAIRQELQSAYLQSERKFFGNKQRKEKHRDILNTCKEKQNGISDEELTALLEFFDENLAFRGICFIQKLFKSDCYFVIIMCLMK
jgi:hypothetical protein